ncbi:MAG: amylo-alpha-1,6-glucosidase [Anaerolineae bacterium]|uniref:amylo-alpha-1,6-glucosidase n=1 Tax=Promineifilum sp. TaxID=2664178 RepID=UPI001DBACEBF|nr:amylo-alpha-1,6-glucosidase [Anaerolineales bacterium]MCB8934526.1 amylo-alpha-1,6-glucosidase [Promineifilum sp.]MCO5179904.1 amylo-alpha-1,6-glucosidase [Promineifilum sp.]MCW5847064.1 amylo-alpha-1,6-glucosidase [Anaerolineae bacterium]
MILDFGREVCGDLAVAMKREWLVTNGIGGYASGTVATMLTRRYHGLLMAALKPPLGRTLLLAKLDETAEYDGVYPDSGRYYPLFTNRWEDGNVEGHGHHYIDRFHLEGTTPVWTYALANALLEKRIWMQPGANTTYVQYRLARATGPLCLSIKALVNYRDYHATTIMNDWDPAIDDAPVAGGSGLRIRMFDEATPFYLFSDRAEITPQFDWYEDLYLPVEEQRGQRDVSEDHLYAAQLQILLRPGESFAVVAGTEPAPNLDHTAAYGERRAYEQALLARAVHLRAPASHHGRATTELPRLLKQLVLAADQFIVDRPTAADPRGKSIIAGYHWFGDWGRDTMIALPGLTLTTGRPEVAAGVLRTYAQFVDQGMLPNRFPDVGETPEYNTVDATLWYFIALREYVGATGDNVLLRELFPILADIIDRHIKGTRYNIHMAPDDALLYAGEPSVQLTWMDAKVEEWVVTPRIGKPVEINALWFNALRIMEDFAAHLGQDPTPYGTLAGRVRAGFARFWDAPMGYCFDVIDGPDGNDLSLRPNQLLAVSLPHCPLSAEQQRSVVDTCARHLLTAHGLRSLSPDDQAFIGHYTGDRRKRDGAYHQGTVWAWLIGPFISAHLRVYQDMAAARAYLEPLLRHLVDHGVGSISEIFEGDAPFAPRGCIAQAWSVAEVLRAWQMTETRE